MLVQKKVVLRAARGIDGLTCFVSTRTLFALDNRSPQAGDTCAWCTKFEGGENVNAEPIVMHFVLTTVEEGVNVYINV